MDIHIWYTLLSAIIGGVMGAKARLGEVLLNTSLLKCSTILSRNVSLFKFLVP